MSVNLRHLARSANEHAAQLIFAGHRHATVNQSTDEQWYGFDSWIMPFGNNPGCQGISRNYFFMQ